MHSEIDSYNNYQEALHLYSYMTPLIKEKDVIKKIIGKLPSAIYDELSELIKNKKNNGEKEAKKLLSIINSMEKDYMYSDVCTKPERGKKRGYNGYDVSNKETHDSIEKEIKKRKYNK